MKGKELMLMMVIKATSKINNNETTGEIQESLKEKYKNRKK